MKVTCPKCQFENQVNISSQTEARVVCARCATIFEATSEQETARGHSPGQTAMPPLAASASLSAGRDAYATRYEPEFDEVLDIPFATQGDYQANESASVLEDVLTTPFDEATPPLEVRSTAPLSKYPLETPLEDQPEFWPEPRTEAPEIFALPEQNGYSVSPSPVTDWPVLSGDRQDFHQGSQPLRPKSNRSLWKRAALVMLVFGVLFALLWIVVGPNLKQRLQQPNNIVTSLPPADNPPTSGSNAAATGAANKTSSTGAAGAAPSAEAKTPGTAQTKAADKPASEDTTKNARAVTSASTAAAKTTRPDAAKPAPESKGQSAAKTAPLEVPFGHSVKQGEGSITLQVAAFNNRTQANERAAQLKSAGIEARVVKADLPDLGTWYRVQIRRFTSREEANRYGAQLKARGVVKDVILTGYQAQ